MSTESVHWSVKGKQNLALEFQHSYQVTSSEFICNISFQSCQGLCTVLPVKIPFASGLAHIGILIFKGLSISFPFFFIFFVSFLPEHIHCFVNTKNKTNEMYIKKPWNIFPNKKQAAYACWRVLYPKSDLNDFFSSFLPFPAPSFLPFPCSLPIGLPFFCFLLLPLCCLLWKELLHASRLHKSCHGFWWGASVLHPAQL